MELRSYQKQLIDDIRASIGQNRRILATLATGGGKTLVFTEMAKISLLKGFKVLIICETLVIKEQIAKAAPSGVTLMMAQTLRRRELQPFKDESKLLIIVDEAHINISLPILEELPNAYLVGFTATPIFKEKARARKIYNSLVQGPQNEELILHGFLSPCRHFARVKKKIEASVGNDFGENEQLAFLGKTNATNLFIEDLKKDEFSGFKKMVVFCVNIKHAESVYEALKSNGYNALLIHSQSEASVAMFTNGSYSIAVCVAMLTKGFDCPSIDTVVLLRATKSVALYLQMLGRGARLSEGKNGFTVLDYGSNGLRLGLFEEKRDWQRIWEGKARGGNAGVGGVKECLKCGALIPVSANVCKHCGALVPKKKEKKITAEHTELVQLQKLGETYANLARMGLYKQAVNLAKEHNVLAAFGKAMGYKNGWSWHKRKRR